MSASAIALLGGAAAPVVEQSGEGPPMLLLHGGAGPASMRPLLRALPGRCAVLPTHPGFDGTARPKWLCTIPDLALCYLALLDALALREVLVIGNSAGGWIAAEMAARRPTSLQGVVLMDAVGLAPTPETGPIVDPKSVPPEVLASLAFADPTKAQPPTPEAAARMPANQRALDVYAGDPFMHDPSLAARLKDVDLPALVLWGDHDRVASLRYGEAYARALPNAGFARVADAGHLPQVEQPERVAEIVETFSRGL